jgi:peptide subunit release factor RF-3
MRTFKDTAGRTWTIALNVWAIKRTRDMAAVDLLDLTGATKDGPASLLQRLIADPILLVSVLWAVCSEDAVKAGLTEEDFGRAMAGDAIDNATKALLEELTDFTPSPRDRARAKRVVEATWTLLDKAQDVLDLQATRNLDAAASRLSTYGSSSGSSPGTSESTPAASH